jgi:hypothetical protein
MLVTIILSKSGGVRKIRRKNRRDGRFRKVRNTFADAQIPSHLMEPPPGFGEFRTIIARQPSRAFPESAAVLLQSPRDVLHRSSHRSVTITNGSSDLPKV